MFVISEPQISLRDAWPVRDLLEPEAQLEDNLVFGNDRDLVLWKWEESAIYSAKSIYRILIEGGKEYWRFEYVWKAKAPPSARLFAYLVLNDKIFSKQVLRRRGINVNLQCVCCLNCSVESTLHLLYLCPYAVEVWFHVSRFLCRPIMKVETTVEKIWDASWNLIAQTRAKESGNEDYPRNERVDQELLEDQ